MIILLLILLPVMVLGQSNELIRTAKLDNLNNLYLDVEFNCYKSDSTNDINVILINNSINDIEVFANSRIMEISTEIKDDKGHWFKVDKGKIMCGTGYEYCKLKPKFYTWNLIKAEEYEGTFDTEIRFSVRINDSILTTKPIEAAIDNSLFLSKDERLLNLINIKLTDPEINETGRKYLLKRKAYLKKEQGKLVESINILQMLIDEYPKDSEILYAQTMLLLNWAEKESEATKYAVYGMVLNQWSKISKKDKYYLSVKQNSEYLNAKLLSKSQWMEMNDLDCEIVDGKYYCDLGNGFNMKMLIQFLNE